MPYLTLEIPETYESITRPVAVKVMDDLMGYMGWKHKPPLAFAGPTENQKLPDTTIGESTKVNFMFNAEAKVLVNVTEEYPEEFVNQKAQLRPEELVFFDDPELGLWMKPSYQPVLVTLEFHCRADSKTKAIQLQQNFKKLVSKGVTNYLHEVTYHYPVPMEHMAILCEVHRCRELQAGYGQSFGEYLKQHFNDKMTVITDQAGKNSYFAIREAQIGIQGWYDFNDTPPTLDKDSDAGSWVTQLSYRFYYDRVEQVVIGYPMVVHNTMLDTRFFQTNLPKQLENFHQASNLSWYDFQKLQWGDRKVAPYSGLPGLSIPYFDDWVADYEYSNCQCLMRVMLGVDPVDLRAVLTLSQLGEWQIWPAALEYMVEAGSAMFQDGMSLFTLNLYEGQRLYDIDRLVIDSGLTIRTQDDMNLRKVYHLQLNLHYDIQTLSPAALILLSKHGSFTLEALKVIDPTLEARGMLPTLLPDGSISITALKEAAAAIHQSGWLAHSDVIYRQWFVGQFIATTHVDNKRWLTGQFGITAARLNSTDTGE